MPVQKNQLKKIEISGYKSIKSCTIELESINVLIGSNGAGKSNFFSSLTLIQSVLNKELQLASGMAGQSSLFYQGKKVTESIKFKVYFNNNSYGFYLTSTEDGRIIFQNEFYGYGTTESSIGCGHEESKWDQGAENKINDFVRAILAEQTWRVYHFHDTGRNSNVKQEHSIDNNHILMADARNLASFLYRIKTEYNHEYSHIVETIRLIAPYFQDFVLEPELLNKSLIRLKWKQKGCDDIFGASQFSDGTLRFICLATLLLQPSILQPNTIIVDEPEIGLHPFAITICAEMFKAVSIQKQLVISTQSVDMLDKFDAKDVVVVDRTENGSSFRRLDEESLQNWLNEYSLGELWKKNMLGGRFSKVVHFAHDSHGSSISQPRNPKLAATPKK